MTRTDTTTEPLTIQGHFIQHLHTALDGGDMVEAEATSTRMVDTFRVRGGMRPAWNAMIVQGSTKGSYRLEKPSVNRPPKPQKRATKKQRKNHR